MIKTIWIKISLFFLFVVSIIGTSLRAIYFLKLPFDFAHLVHAHSHTAFQGWIYIALFILTTNLFLNETQIKKGHYDLQLKLTVLLIFGVLVSFTLQGYGLYSILFSTFFQLMNYWFIFSFFRDINQSSAENRNSISVLFVKTGLWLALLSTLMPLGIGILSAKGLSGSEAYETFIYSFLHFQYNGWFLFICFGLFFKILERDNYVLPPKLVLGFYTFLTIAVLPALALSLLGMSYRSSLMVPAHLAGILQIIGCVLMFVSIRPVIKKWFSKKDFWPKVFFSVFLLSFLLKIVFQYLSVFPVFQDLAFHNKNMILAYLHLSLIGVISFFILGLFIDLKWLSTNRFSKAGNLLILSGFIITEAVLLLGAFSIFYSYPILFFGSATMALGILLLLLSPQKINEE